MELLPDVPFRLLLMKLQHLFEEGVVVSLFVAPFLWNVPFDQAAYESDEFQLRVCFEE